MSKLRKRINDFTFMFAILKFLGATRLYTPEKTFKIIFEDIIDFFRHHLSNGLDIKDTQIIDNDIKAAELFFIQSPTCRSLIFN